MASVTENRLPETVPPEPERSEQRYVDQQIRRTRRALKMVDLTAGLLTLIVGVLLYLLAAAVLEHWVVPGGWSPTARTVLLVALVAGIVWYGWRMFWPLVSQPINPAFAAQAIEKNSPSLKNSLLNLLLLRDRRRQISRQVYQAIERQAAQRLAEVPVDSAVDRGAILRLGYVLAAVVALCALYQMLSPKNPIDSAGRLLMPWSDIPLPSRVKILDVQPGDAAAARGEQLTVSAEISGISDDEPVRLRYSTVDGQIVDQEVLMTPQAGGLRYECRVPGRAALGGSGGIQNDLTYWIEAGDAISARYDISVFSQPTLVVDRIRYEYPSYTGDAPREVQNTGDISAIEGTIVKIWAVSNQPIASAHVDFEADGRHDLLMNSEDRQASTNFALELRDDRRSPRYQSYVLRYTTDEGRKNPSPPKYRIDVQQDYAPEVELLAPEEQTLDVGLNDEVIVEVEARDPDYAVQKVSLLGEVAGLRVLEELLLDKNHTGRFVGQLRLVPVEMGLKVGDELEYWAAAADNRRPEPNLAFTEHRKIRVIGPGENGGGQQGPQEGNQDQQQGEGGQEGEGGQRGDDGQQGQGGQSGGAGDENSQASPNDQQGGEGGLGQEGDDSGNNADAQPGESGESAENENQSEADGSGGGNTPSDRGEDSPTEQNGNNSQSESGEDSSAGEPSAGQGKVSPEGDDDAEAFERIADHFDQQEGESDEDAGESGEAGQEAREPQDSGKQQESSKERGTADGSPEQGDNSDQQQPSKTEDVAGKQNERTSDSAGAEGEDSAQQDSEAGEKGQSEKDSSADGGEMQESQGQPGAGQNPGEDEGSPAAGENKPTDKPSEDTPGNTQNDQEAPSQGVDNRESDSQGSQGGDRSGGGQEGAGQQAEDEGTGAAGENQAADEGAGQAGEQGEGESGANAGKQDKADGKTGRSSGDQPGRGGEQSDQTGSQAGGEQESTGESSTADAQNSADGSGSQPDSGGRGSSSNNLPPPPGEPVPGDEANLDYARKRTDLVIEKLDDQLRNQEVDEKLLDKLGWTADELRRFVKRWKNLKSQAEGAGPEAEGAQQELDNALRSLGLRPNRRTGFQSETVKDKLRDLQEAYRGRTPLEYQELMRKYVKGTASGKNDE